MKYITPDFYHEFHCIADQCPDTCCAGWAITIDPKSIRHYQNMKGAVGNRLHNSIDWEQHTFLQYDHKCIFLNEDNLCDLYSEAGADSLCQTCKQYPRHMESYLNVREFSIGISCPEVARMLLTRTDKISFTEKVIEKQEEVDVAFQSELFHQLNDARRVMFDLLQDRTLDMMTRMGLVLGLGHDLQKRIRKRDYESMAHLISHYKKKETIKHLVEKLSNEQFILNKEHKLMDAVQKEFMFAPNSRRALMMHLWKELHHVEAINKDWAKKIKQAHHILDSMTSEKYSECYIEFYQKDPMLSIQMEHLMVYFIYGYSNGAVYDGELYSKVKFAIFHTLAIEELFFSAWVEDDYQLSQERQIEIVHKYAREMEHQDENIEYLDSTLRSHKEFYFDKIVKCLNYNK